MRCIALKILVVTQCYYPDNYNINSITGELVKRGHDVTVVTGLPDYTTSKIPKEYRWFKNRTECKNGVQIYRVSVIARHKGAFMRCLNYLSFVISGSLFCKFKSFDEFDCIYVWGVTPVTMAIPAITLKKRFKKPILFYCLDLWPESIKSFNFKENSLFFKAIKKLSNWIYSQIDLVAISSKAFAPYIEQVNKFAADKIVYLPQYSEETHLKKNLTSKNTNEISFIYAGNIGTFQSVECIIAAIEKIKTDIPFKLHIVGDGSMKSTYEKIVQERCLSSKIIFHGRIPAEKMGQYYAFADACILTLSGKNKIGETLPLKLQSYMAEGKPIIAAINGSACEVINESKCGLVGPADDADVLAANMLRFLNCPDKFKACGENGRNYFKENFSKKQHFETLEACFRSL